MFLNGDTAEKITKIKQQEGPDLHVFGSANLVQTLLKHDLVDALWLKIFPITLGGGKRLFADGTIPAAFKVTESTVTSKGIIIVNLRTRRSSPYRKSINIRAVLAHFLTTPGPLRGSKIRRRLLALSSPRTPFLDSFPGRRRYDQKEDPKAEEGGA